MHTEHLIGLAYPLFYHELATDPKNKKRKMRKVLEKERDKKED